MITWLAHLNTKKKDIVSHLLKQLQNTLGVPISEIDREVYYKDENWRVHFTTPDVPGDWEHQVFNALRLGQRVAYEWNLSGDVDGELSGIAADKFRQSGILWLSWEIRKT